MAKVIDAGYSDTPISGVTKLSLDRGLVNFGKDFRIQKQTPDDVTLVNLLSPIDRQERFRFAISDISNIYNGTGIDQSVWSPSTKGLSLLVSLQDVCSVTDDSDPLFRVDLPVTVNVTVKMPKSDQLTTDIILAYIGRAVSGLFDTGTVDGVGLNRLLRGSLIPSDL